MSVSVSEIQRRYLQKITHYCDGVDPFLLPVSAFTTSVLPKNVQYFDIFNYCINKSSAYTLEAFRAYKTLEAYKMFENGFVQKIASKEVSVGILINARVSILTFNHFYIVNKFVCIYNNSG